jgi:hypothetical protein
MTSQNLHTDEERYPAVAGMFYPKDPIDLSRMIAGFLAESERKVHSDEIYGIIAPHAGYMYSGAVAATAYKQLEGLKYDRVVVISPSHTTFFTGCSIYNGQAYVTPLGKLFIDTELSAKLATINPSKVFLSARGHTGGGTRQEHALEVQLPILQVVLGDFKLIPIVMGEQEWDVISALSEALVSVFKNTSTLIVASSDLSHFYSSQIASDKDLLIRQQVEKYNPEGVFKLIAEGKAEACGGGPMASVMLAARKLGAARATVTDYADSGKVTGDHSEVVGYLAAVLHGE